MDINKNSRNIVMWLRKTDNHLSEGFFSNRKSIAYHRFFKEISERDNFRFVFGVDSYKGAGIFSNAALYKDSEVIETKDNFKADVIYQYSKLANLDFDSGGAVITNTPAFREFCVKINAYNYMPQFFPVTFLTKSIEEIKEVLTRIKTEKVVLKPNRGKNGDDVFIFKLSEVDFNILPKDKLKDEGFLIQEFIDTSDGISGVVSSYHDLRIITHGDKISLCHVREPAPGSLIGNSHKGALITEIDIEAIPDFILKFYKKVHSEIIKKYSHPMYSMDIGIGKNGPKLIELNSHTAFPGETFKCMNRFIGNLIEHLETVN